MALVATRSTQQNGFSEPCWDQWFDNDGNPFTLDTSKDNLTVDSMPFPVIIETITKPPPPLADEPVTATVVTTVATATPPVATATPPVAIAAPAPNPDLEHLVQVQRLMIESHETALAALSQECDHMRQELQIRHQHIVALNLLVCNSRVARDRAMGMVIQSEMRNKRLASELEAAQKSVQGFAEQARTTQYILERTSQSASMRILELETVIVRLERTLKGTHNLDLAKELQEHAQRRSFDERAFSLADASAGPPIKRQASGDRMPSGTLSGTPSGTPSGSPSGNHIPMIQSGSIVMIPPVRVTLMSPAAAQ